MFGYTKTDEVFVDLETLEIIPANYYPLRGT
jgi:hypothetical protein